MSYSKYLIYKTQFYLKINNYIKNSVLKIHFKIIFNYFNFK